MNNFIYGLILSILPISELRGGIPVAMSSGIDPWIVFFSCVAVNIFVIPIAYFFLDFLHHKFLKFERYRVLFGKVVIRTKRKIESKIGTKWQYPALFAFVAVPLPGTGAYTGVIAAWLFGMNRIKSFIAIALGVLVAGVIVTLATLGVYSLI
nr:ligand-binding protein SH3 [Nanoarchaeum sp.]